MSQVWTRRLVCTLCYFFNCTIPRTYHSYLWSLSLSISNRANKSIKLSLLSAILFLLTWVSQCFPERSSFASSISSQQFRVKYFWDISSPVFPDPYRLNVLFIIFEPKCVANVSLLIYPACFSSVSIQCH